MDIQRLQKFKVTELNSLAKEYKIKNISKLKKDEKIKVILKFINENKNDNEQINDNEKTIELDPEPLIITFRDYPKILLRKEIDIHPSKVTLDYVKDTLKLNPDIGDIFQLGKQRENYFYGKTNDNIIPLTGSHSDYIYIPYEISREFRDAFDLYYELFEEEGLEDNFYGVEIKYDDKFIKDNFGILDNKYEHNKIFRVNPNKYSKSIHVFIDGLRDPIELLTNISSNNKYLNYINSFDYIDQIKLILSKKVLDYSIEIQLKDHDDDDDNKLSKEESDFIYTNFPNTCIVDISIEYGIVTMFFRYNESAKKEIDNFIEKHYFSNKKNFINKISRL